MARIEEAVRVRAKVRFEHTFAITQRLWIDAEVDGRSVQGWAIAGALTNGGENKEQTAYLLATNHEVPFWVLSRDVTTAVLEATGKK